MTTESIRAKYNFGFEEGKYEIVRSAIRYGVFGVVIGALVKLTIHKFNGTLQETVSK